MNQQHIRHGGQAPTQGRVLPGLLQRVFIAGSLLGTFGCVSDSYIPNAECSNGTVQELSCGVLQLGVQQQVCVDFQWQDEGACDEDLLCRPGEIRETPCGLNDEGVVQDLCGNNRWQELSACDAKDLCKNGDQVEEACGLNGRGTLKLSCESGAWVVGSCFETDVCKDGEPQSETCSSLEHTSRVRFCEEGEWANSWSECEPMLCTDGAVDAVLCGVEDRGWMRSICVGGQWASTNECEMNAAEIVSNEKLNYVIALDGSLWVSGGEDLAVSGRSVPPEERAFLREPFAERMWIVDSDHFALAANHACAISGHTVVCWGDNESGQGGVPVKAGASREPRVVPSVGSASNPPIQVVVTSQVSCALLADASVRCWGKNGPGGGVGFGKEGEIQAPGQPVGLSPGAKSVKRLFAREHVVCAVVHDDDVYCWGDNIRKKRILNIGTTSVLPDTRPIMGGLLGLVEQTEPILPTRIPSLRRTGHLLVDLHVYRDNGCAFYSDKTVTCWGENAYGEVGNDSTNQAISPVVTLPAGTIKALSLHSSAHRRCATMSDGTLRCWGRQQLGDANARLFPEMGETVSRPHATLRFRSAQEPVLQAALTAGNTCAVLQNGSVQCTGTSSSGHFGRGATMQSFGDAHPIICPDEGAGN